MKKALCLLALAGFACAVDVPLSDAVSTNLPSVNGDGFFCELFLIGGNGTPTPARLDAYQPNANLRSPVINFPNPGDTVSISSSFTSFFNNTVYAPESVQDLDPAGFIMRITTNLKITADLDLNTATPEIDLQIRQGSDDGHYMVVGSQYLGSSGEHGFTWYSYDLAFEDEGMYPYYQLFAANNAGISGVELQWNTALSGGWQVIPQAYAFPNAGGGQCEQKIYFDELAEKTTVTQQYAGLGAIFDVVSGDVAATSAQPLKFVPVSAANVLADPNENPVQEGIVNITFTTTEAEPATTDYFSTYVIDAEETGATITALNLKGEQLAQEVVRNQGSASKTFVEIVQSDIYEVVVSLGSGADTSALDNICWATPERINLPDIAVSGLSTTATQLWGAMPIDVSITASNNGNSSLISGWELSFYLSDDQLYDDGVDLSCGTLACGQDIPAGGSAVISGMITLADDISGDKYLIAIADQADSVTEFPDDDDNIAVAASPLPSATDHIPPKILFQSPDGLVPPRVDGIQVEFSEPVDPATFTTDRITLTNPDSLPVAILSLENTEGNVWYIGFSRQMTVGTYSLSISAAVKDPSGNLLDGNADGTGGDDYTGTFEVTTDPIQTSLFNWTKHAAAGNGNWTVSTDGLSVFQSINGEPTFFVSDFDLTDSKFEGTFKVETTSDDDYIGFVFAFNDTDSTPATLDSPFYLFQWKQTVQTSGEEGFKIIRLNNPAAYDYWNGTTDSNGTVLHSKLGSADGWADNTLYEFSLSYQPDSGNIRIIVNRPSDGAELYNSGLITDANPLGAGRVGFYNYSQASVRYAGFTSAVLQPPVAVAGSGYSFTAANTNVLLDATGSYDPDDMSAGFAAISAVQWDIGNDGIDDDDSRINSTETITLAEAIGKGLSITSDILVGLTVYDLDALEDSALTSVSYTSTAPAADAGNADYGIVPYGGSVSLLGSASDADLDAGVGESLTYEWDIAPATSASQVGDGFAAEAQAVVSYDTLLAELGAQSGTIYLNVKDSSGLVSSASAAVALELSNVEISAPNIYGYAYAGKPIVARYTVTNTGTCTFSGSWTDKVYLSDDDIIGGDTQVGAQAYAFPINTEQLYNGSVTFTVPAAVAEGQKWLVIETNAAASVLETSRADNILLAGPVVIRHTPLVDPIGDVTIVAHEPYQSVLPSLADGTPPITWSAIQIPDASVQVDPDTGQVFWADPAESKTPYTIKIAAQNDGGFDEESWAVTVVTTPQIAPISDITIASGVSFTSPAPVQTANTVVTWSLVSGPAGMTVNTSSGRVTWPSPLKSETPYPVTIKAENIAGSDEQTFNITVLDKPVIAALSDDNVHEWANYTRNDITLTSGGDTAVTWSLIDRPAGMTIDPASAVIIWNNAIPSASSYRITVKAANSAGYDTESFNLSVDASPVIAGVGDEAISDTAAYSRAMVLVRGAAPVTWSINQAPAGMTIDAGNGVISWPSPVTSVDPYPIEVQASNAIGSDVVNWNISVKQPPSIESIADVMLDEGASFSYQPALLTGTAPVSWARVRGPAGLTVNGQTGEIDWPAARASVTPWEVVIQALNSVGSDTETFNVSVPVLYSATIETDTEIAMAGSPVTLTGHAYWVDGGEAAAEVPVTIRILLKGMRRLVSVTSDASGDFTYTWTPFATEAGHYKIAADHPVVAADIIQDEFDMYGIAFNPGGMRHGLDVNEPKTYSVTLKNLGDQQLTGISYALNNPHTPELDMQVVSLPTSLGGYGVSEIKYQLTGSVATSEPYTPTIDVTCDQGADTRLSFQIMVYQPLAELKSDVSNLNGQMIRGVQKFVDITLSNVGGSSTGPINIAIPSNDYMRLVTPAVMGAIEPHESATLTLLLEPPADAPLNVNTGNIAINATGTGLSIPFSFETVSALVSNLLVEATDDYTFQTAEAPKLFGASVKVMDPLSGAVLYSGVTDASGEILFEDIPEAYYKIEVKADNHGTFNSTVLTTGGQTLLVSAFLPLNLITYNWTVRPTTIEDHYTFTVEAVFETNVPAPVITVSPALTDLTGMDEAEMQVDYTLTNQGLIRADDTEMLFDGGNSNFEFIPLVEEIGSIEAKSSIVVPVLIRDLSKVQPLTALAKARMNEPRPMSLDCSVSIKSYVGYRWECGSDHRWHQVPFYFNMPVVECTGGSTIGGGNILDGSGGGETWYVGTGSSSWGGSDDTDWYIPPIYWPTGTSHDFTTDGSCNPCVDKVGKALLNCAISFLPLDCAATVVKGSAECASDCYSGSAWSCAKSCAGAMISTAASCGGAVAKKATPIGLVWNLVWCLWDVGTACLGDEAAILAMSCDCTDPDVNELAALAMEIAEVTGMEATLNATSLDYLLKEARTQARRLEDVFNMYTLILGSEVWFSGTDDESDNLNLAYWLEAFGDAMNESSPSAELIDEAEAEALLAMPLPGWVDSTDAEYAIARWNNTVAYWQAGITELADVPDGQSTNFVPFSDFKDVSQLAAVALGEQMEDGFEYMLEGAAIVYGDIQSEVDNPSSGVCARVKIQIKQEAVISRSAFEAVLELSNDGTADPLENVNVEVKVVDADGNDMTDLFGIHPPELTGIENVSGTGSLAASSACSALWLIVPTQDAAPTEPVKYYVKGSLEYDLGGQHVTIPLYPAEITVMPNPNLVVHYFLEREVYADDPFTPEVVEPSVPFSLGLMMKNTGHGAANDVEITSSQPEVVENEKGLLIDFEIIGTIIGSDVVTPSLKVNLGDIDPGTTAIAQWLMVCSLQGEFIDYNATFEHVDGLGNPRLSLVESVDIHEMEHVVTVDSPADDGKPDFLVNDDYDSEDMPDTLYNSDGNEYLVSAVSDAYVDSVASAGDLQVVVTEPNAPAGWAYVRIDNPVPAEPELALESVVRSDGKQILVPDNAWTTYKVNHKQDGDELEHFLHIFDYAGTGIYTVTYAPSDRIKPVVESVVAGDVTEPEAELIIEVTYSDDVAIDILSIDKDDLVVSGPNGFASGVSFLYTDVLGDGTPRTGFYTLVAPDGGWSIDHNGSYSISLAAQEVRDSSFNYANSAVIGGFDVDIELLDQPEMTLVLAARITRTVYEYEYSLAVDNQTGRQFRDQLCTINGLPALAAVIHDSVLFANLPTGQTSVSPTTIKFRLDLANPVDWNQIYFEYFDYHRGDLNGDATVDMQDLSAMAESWLTGDGAADIFPAPNGDGLVNIGDFAELSRGWMNQGQ